MTSAPSPCEARDRRLEATSVGWSVPGPARQRRTILHAVNLSLEPGQMVGMTGPSGSGKTSLLRVLSGLTVPDHGVVRLGETVVRDVRTRAGRACAGRIGVVFQAPRAAMDPRRTLRDAISLAATQAERRLRSTGAAAAGPAPRLDELAHHLGLTDDVLARRPGQVSDGQLQRAAVLRTMAHRPDVVLCDEVTAALDPIAGASVMRLLQWVAREHRVGVLVFSHDHRLLDAVADEVLSMDMVDRR